MMIDGNKDSTVGERKLIWDEENRLLAVDENGFVSNYWYDAVSNELSVVNKAAFPVKGISTVIDGIPMAPDRPFQKQLVVRLKK